VFFFNGLDGQIKKKMALVFIALSDVAPHAWGVQPTAHISLGGLKKPETKQKNLGR
jgi:hypothetical protein